MHLKHFTNLYTSLFDKQFKPSKQKQNSINFAVENVLQKKKKTKTHMNWTLSQLAKRKQNNWWYTLNANQFTITQERDKFIRRC